MLNLFLAGPLAAAVRMAPHADALAHHRACGRRVANSLHLARSDAHIARYHAAPDTSITSDGRAYTHVGYDRNRHTYTQGNG